MRRTLDEMRAQLLKDLRWAENATQCKRRGCAARAATVGPDGLALESAWVAMNGAEGCSAKVGGCGCVHAEARLIVRMLKLGVKPQRQLTLLTTIAPCQNCAALAAESGLFGSAAWLLNYHDEVGLLVMQRAGIQLMPPGASTIRCSVV